MKNASQIISSIQKKPQFSKLSKYKCIKKIESIFTPALAKMIKFAYFKNDVLFFVLNHPAGKQEFDNNIQSIKSALKYVTPEECKDINITDIKAFVTHTPQVNTQEVSHKLQSYPERSSGNFKNEVHEEKLKTLIQAIQNIIKARQ